MAKIETGEADKRQFGFIKLFQESTDPRVTTMVKMIEDASLLLADDRTKLPHTALNQFGLVDNMLLATMRDYPIVIDDNQELQFTDLLNGGYQLRSGIVVPSMFSIQNGDNFYQTRIRYKEDAIQMQLTPNQWHAVGSAFGSHPLFAVSEIWEQTGAVLQDFIHSQKKSHFYVPPSSFEATKPIDLEQKNFSQVQSLFTLLSECRTVWNPEDIEILNDPRITQWKTYISVRNMANDMFHKVSEMLENFGPSQKEKGSIGNSDLFHFSHSTSEFTKPEYYEGLADMLTSFLSNTSEHLYKKDLLRILNHNRSFPRRLLMGVNKDLRQFNLLMYNSNQLHNNILKADW